MAQEPSFDRLGSFSLALGLAYAAAFAIVWVGWSREPHHWVLTSAGVGVGGLLGLMSLVSLAQTISPKWEPFSPPGRIALWGLAGAALMGEISYPLLSSAPLTELSVTTVWGLLVGWGFALLSCFLALRSLVILAGMINPDWGGDLQRWGKAQWGEAQREQAAQQEQARREQAHKEQADKERAQREKEPEERARRERAQQERAWQQQQQREQKQHEKAGQERAQQDSGESGDGGEAGGQAWFVVLGIAATASIEEINKAYKTLIGQYHPDKVATLGPKLKMLAEKESKKINAAIKEARRLHAKNM